MERLEVWRWVSVCSAHHKYNTQCETCKVGQWYDVNHPEYLADHELFKTDPDAWIAKHNNFYDPPYIRNE
jgi:hypothetical protein